MMNMPSTRKLPDGDAEAIDVHTHFVPEHLAGLPAGSSESTWPHMACGPSCDHRHVMVKGEVYRTVTDQCWDAPRRIHDMADTGVTHQVISPMPELLSYWMEARDAAVLHRDINEQMARLVSAHPEQFSALAAVPLQDVDVAVAELEYARAALNLSGVEVGSNVNGVPIGSTQFDSFFAAAERLGMAVFVHAIRPAGMDRLIGAAVLQQALGFPNEIGLAAASAISTNLMLRFPRLRICFSHGGGSLAMLLPRLEHAWSIFPELKTQLGASPRDQARRFFYDNLVYDRDTLAFLMQRFGHEALVLGTDYPFSIREKAPMARIAELGVDAALAAQLTSGNARRFLTREH